MNIKTFIAVFAIAALFTQCKNSGAGTTEIFCDTTCQNDAIRFSREDLPKKPYVYITMNQCFPDTVFWAHTGLTNKLAMTFSNLVGSGIKVNKSHAAAHIIGEEYVWLEFNDCETGRGYLIKLPFDKSKSISKFSSALTRFDPKFSVQDGLICYADYSFLFVEDMATGKSDKLLMGDEELKIDFNNIHATFDSVNITRNRIFIILTQYGKKKTLEKAISL